MPTYEYECDACGHKFEEFQSFSEAPLKKCPECKKSKLRRLIGTGAAVVFKGSGFYQTDYRSESYKSAAKADQEKSTDKPAATGDKPAATGTADKTGASAPAAGADSGGGTKSKEKSPKSKT